MNVRFIKTLLQFGYKFSRIFGLVPFRYNDETKTFVTAWFDIIYPVVVYLLFAYTYPTSGLSVVSVLNPLVVVAFFYMTVTTISVIFLVQCLNAQRICVFLNKAAHLNSELYERYRNFSGAHYRSHILLALTKTTVVNFLAQTAVAYCCTVLGQVLTGRVDYFVIFIISVAYFLQTIVPNMFYVGVLGGSFHYEQINREIIGVVAEAATVAHGCRDFESEEVREHFEELTNRLNDIAVLHGRLTTLITTANSICSLQLLVSTANFVGILLIEVIGVIILTNFILNKK